MANETIDDSSTMQPSTNSSSSSSSITPTVSIESSSGKEEHQYNGQNSSFSSLTQPSSAVESYSADISNMDSIDTGNSSSSFTSSSNDSSSSGGGERPTTIRNIDNNRPHHPRVVSEKNLLSSSTNTTPKPANATKKKMKVVSTALKDAMDELDRIWNIAASSSDPTNCYSHSETASSSTDADRVRETVALLVKAFSQELYDPAIRAIAENEALKAEHSQLLSKLERTQKEVQQLQRSEQKSKESIKNLLKAVDGVTEDTKDSSQAKLVEAKLRAQLLQARRERDASSQIALLAERSLELLTAEADALKVEKNRLKHENFRLEREALSSRSLAESLSKTTKAITGSSSSGENADFYKDKAKDLENHLQGMQARLLEKNQEIRELKHCRDRNLSQNRLEDLKEAKKPRLS